MKRRNVYLVSISLAALLSLSITGCKQQEEPPAEPIDSSSQSEPMMVDEPLVSQPIISEYTLSTLTENHLAIFQVAIEGYPEQINSGTITIQQADALQSDYIEIMVMEGELPENGKSLFMEWKRETGYYDQFKGIQQPEVTDEQDEQDQQDQQTTGSQQQSSGTQQSSGSTSSQSSSQPSGNTNPTGGNSSKPQPSTDQQQQQGSGDTYKEPEHGEQTAITDKEFVEDFFGEDVPYGGTVHIGE